MEIKVFEKDGQLVTTSTNIADVFGKNHAHVMRDIRNIIDKWEELGLSNLGLSSYFIEDQYVNEQGKSQPMYYLTKKGTARLVMSFTGINAERFKIGYIERFDQMEQQIQQARELIAQAIPTLSPLEMMRNQLDLMIQQEKEIKALQSRVTQYEDVITKVKEDLDRISPDSEFFTVMAYCKSIGKPVDSNKAKNYGSQCSRLSRNKGMHIGEVPHERWKTVNTYHISILKEVIK